MLVCLSDIRIFCKVKSKREKAGDKSVDLIQKKSLAAMNGILRETLCVTHGEALVSE